MSALQVKVVILLGAFLQLNLSVGTATNLQPTPFFHDIL
jgi:hypothetical protein